ncbi:hypothetical protein EV702DRAFT_1199653 [Suillus placidus]|uniref:Uncharacterized protein n=1 Tax=Suillus placidus TaxID=48579 RepID=A0A9P6ZRC6_9AGAM|nr:hypothetical protein EV702DRAFT_1199653 [Suillus placidus]
MLWKVKEALPKLSGHKAALDDLKEGLKVEYAEALSRWKEQVEAWEHDPSQPNPYKQSTEKITLASVRLELAKEDMSELELGGFHKLHEDCSPSVLISSSLELEEQHGVVIAPKSFELLLPSQVGRTDPCDLKFQKIEWKVRYAQAHDTLHSNLRVQTAILKYKDWNLHGQGSNTQARNMLKGIDTRIEVASTQYQDARRALVILAPFVKETGWQSSLCLLNRQDIQGMSDLLWGETEGRQSFCGYGICMVLMETSWTMMDLWKCKARAHTMQWKEELELLQEEMQRILQFFDWQAMSWDEHTDQNWSGSPAEREGQGCICSMSSCLASGTVGHMSFQLGRYLCVCGRVPWES